MIENKPNKTIYKNQKEVHDYIIEKLKIFIKDISKAYLVNSLTSGTFRVYEKEYQRYLGSDIDLVIPKKELKKEWKYEGEFHNWHKRYNAGEIKYQKTKHPINIMIPIKDTLEDFWRISKELNWKVERLM